MDYCSEHQFDSTANIFVVKVNQTMSKEHKNRHETTDKTTVSGFITAKQQQRHKATTEKPTKRQNNYKRTGRDIKQLQRSRKTATERQDRTTKKQKMAAKTQNNDKYSQNNTNCYKETQN